MGEGSHYVAATIVGEALVSRGVSVTFIIGNTFEFRTRHSLHSQIFSFETVNLEASRQEVYNRLETMVSAVLNQASLTEHLKILSEWQNDTSRDCDLVFQDDVLRRLVDTQFDLIVYDPSWPCTALLAEYINITKVSLIPTALITGFVRLHGNPLNPAFVTEANFGFPVKMSFFQRVANVLAICLHHGFLSQRTGFDDIREKFGIRNRLTGTLKSTALVLSSSDPLVDQRFPSMPHHILIGGLTTCPPQPLPEVSFPCVIINQ